MKLQNRIEKMPAPKISILALRSFIAVYEEQSFSKAALRENATQSGMSTQVKNLELKLGVRLLERGRNEYSLTTAGKIIYREGQEILHRLMQTETTILEMGRSVSGLVRLGMIPSLTRSVFIKSFEKFTACYPSVEISLLEEYSGSLMRRVLDGELDFAIVPSGDIPTGLTADFVARDREMIVSSLSAFNGSPHLSSVPLKALSGAKLIVPSKANIRRHHIDSVLASHGVQISELVEIDGMLATIELLGQSDWMSILPSAICYADKDGIRRKLSILVNPSMGVDYIIVKKSEDYLSAAARLLSESMVEGIQALLSDWDDL